MELKQHIGILVMCAIVMFLSWAFRDDLNSKFAWYLPFTAAFMMWGIVEAVGWTAYYFFFT